MVGLNNIPEETMKTFNESIKVTKNNYTDHLSLAENNGQLIKIGPMTKNEATLFFCQYHLGTFPLYILKMENEYFAYH